MSDEALLRGPVDHEGMTPHNDNPLPRETVSRPPTTLDPSLVHHNVAMSEATSHIIHYEPGRGVGMAVWTVPSAIEIHPSVIIAMKPDKLLEVAKDLWAYENVRHHPSLKAYALQVGIRSSAEFGRIVERISLLSS